MSDLQIIAIIAIILGVAWRIAMPFYKRVLNGEMTLDDFDRKYLFEGLATIAYAVPIGAILFLQYVPPEGGSLILIFIAAFAWGYTAMNLTDGAMPWVKFALDRTGIKPLPKPDENSEECANGHNCPDVSECTEDHNCPSEESEEGVANTNAPAKRHISYMERIFGKGTNNVTKNVTARLELAILVPLQLVLTTIGWNLASSIGQNDWEVVSQLFSNLWKLGLVIILILWGRNVRTWVTKYVMDRLETRADISKKALELQAQYQATPEVIRLIQNAVTLVGHSKQALAHIPDWNPDNVSIPQL